MFMNTYTENGNHNKQQLKRWYCHEQRVSSLYLNIQSSWYLSKALEEYKDISPVPLRSS